MTLNITGGTLITPHQTLENYTLTLSGDKIAGIHPAQRTDGEVIDARGLYVVPGFIDVHVHGSAGHDTMDATSEAIHTLGRFFARHGVTSYYPTTMSAPANAITRAIENVSRTPQPIDGAQHLGVHVEGPFLNRKYPGAQPASALRDPDTAEYEGWFDSGVVKLITVASELKGGLELIREGVQRGIEFALGHTAASYEDVIAAVDVGARQATHTFNAMLGLHHRNPGTLGAVLTDDRIYAQIIGDGVHTHPAMVKLLVRAKGAGRTILITDAMRATGMADGTYALGDDQFVTVQGGIARTADGALAGSTATLDGVLRNVIQFAGVSLAEALQMATSTPAEAMNLSGRKGVLAEGADADIVLLDQMLQVCMTIVAGRVVYSAL